MQIQTSRIETKVMVHFGEIPSLEGSKKARGHVCKISEVRNNMAPRQQAKRDSKYQKLGIDRTECTGIQIQVGFHTVAADEVDNTWDHI